METQFLVPFDDIIFQKQLDDTDNFTTYISTLSENKTLYVAKIIKNESTDLESKVKNYVEVLQRMNHPCIIPFYGFCLASQNEMNQNIIINKFASHFSLQQIIDKRNKGENMPWWDPVRQFIIIYGIGKAMEYLHNNKIIHQKLTPSNILVDENLEPQITDFNMTDFCSSLDLSLPNLIKNKLFYYVDPNVLNGKKVTVKSDVYSFAIITIQILSGNSQIYEDESDLEKLIDEIKNGLMPMIPDNFPNDLRDLLTSCLNNDPIIRPPFRRICLRLESILDNLQDISKEKILQEYKEKILHPNNDDDDMNPEIKKMKEAADNGDSDMMYMFAMKRLKGINCKKNETEATRYLKMAKKKGSNAAKRQLSLLRGNSGSIANSTSYETFNIIDSQANEASQDNQQSFEENNTDNNISINDDNNDNYNDNTSDQTISQLADDPMYDQPELKIDDLINNIDQEMKKNYNKFQFKKEDVEQQNFIFTEGAEERLQKLYNYINVGVPVLLEGPTGTSKTLSSEIVCKLLGRELIRFNLSSETKTQDLIGRYVGDENSWAGITQQDGPFYRAFQEGKVLLLDEINLASASVLQCIEEALDSGVLSIEIPGRPLKSIKMHPDFRVIATQNPNKGSYAHKRQNLGLKFYSRFQIINFPAFTEKELLFIGEGLAKKFGYDNLDVIKDIVKFHKEWSENKLIADDPQCFTIREIAATVKALSQKESIYDTIMTIYGARYQSILKEELKKVLNKYPRLTKDTKDFDLPQFPGCYVNNSLKSVVKSTIFSLKNGRNVIITGKEGCGKTQVALWISENYNNQIQSNLEKQSFFCVCTEEIKVADLVGHQAPSGKSDGTSELIKWQDGFLTKAIKLGMCSVLESLDEAPATVTERLNGLLDQKYDNQQQYFDIPENSANPRVPIRDSFRIIATANIDKIAQMSPAFLNRFDIIVLEDQIDNNITEKQYCEMLSTILKKNCSDLKLKLKTPDLSTEQFEQKDNLLDDSDFDFSGSDDDDQTQNDNDNKNSQNNNDNDADAENNNDEIMFKYIETIIPMIYKKIKDEKNISRISKFCNAIVKLHSAFQKNDKILDKDIIDFAFLLLRNTQQLNIPNEIEKELLGMFQDIQDNTDDPFFYKDSPNLCSFLAKLQAYSIIEQPVCVTGPTGAGKTSAARAFARMRPHKSSFKSGFQMHSFHSGTKVSHFFGSTTLLDGKIVFHDGTLTKSLKYGLVFIADEFNLSTQSVMKSLALALDPTIGKNVFIPGIGQIINISPEFNFIACQNELGTLGRNAIPDSIAQRFVYIDYPKPDKDDIQKICINIAKENFTGNKVFKPSDEALARYIANYMIGLNEKKLVYIPQWSLRDITKLFRRIYPQNSFKKFKNITPLHHVLFYTMSVVSPNEIDNVIEDVRSVMKLSFNLNDESVDEYIECYKATPKIEEIPNEGFFMMKGPNSGIAVSRINKLIIDKTLPSLWNAMFQVYLSDDKEPILLMGNSGFKTFLSQLFLPKAQIITLNQETNVAQLLGSSGFMTNSEAKLFYIEYIYKILQKDSLIHELRDKWQNGNLKRDDIIPLITQAKRADIPFSFHYALEHLAEKLLDDSQNNQDCILSNTTLEFHPGLFLNSILQGQSLILKDLSNLPTIVLERFNELFSGKQNITLSEDIHNTFTPADYKELTNFNESFRVFATCPANSPSRLSEAVLSRFTVISVPDYLSTEQEIVLKSYIQINKLLFDQSDIERLGNFAISFYKNLNIHFTFPQMIKVIEITSKLNKETSLGYQKLNLGITLYRVLGGILDSSKKKEKLFEQIKMFFDVPQIYHDQINDKCALLIENKENILGVSSSISNLFLKCASTQECQTKVAFTGSFNDLLDLLHMGLTIHNPIILEGPPGQGKHTAIHFIANMLNINVVHIMISQSTKVEDLFGKDVISRQQDGIHVEMVETPFIKIVKNSENIDKKSLIILENINSASPALLNALVPVFNTYSTSILLPNGSTIQKGRFDIIGIFNTQQVSSSKDKLPSSLINSSIYHIVQKPKESEIMNIILTKFIIAKLDREEAIRFNDNYIQSRQILSKEGTSSEIFTLNDIEKYILLRTLTKEFFDETTISQMIFAYKFSSDEMIQKILKELNFENMRFNPLFSYDVPPENLLIRISNDNNNALLLPLLSAPKDSSLVSKIDSLTLSQKHCLIFLACSVLSKRSCVIQGDTASGKSYLIRLIAELAGAKLNVFQMNSDSNVSMLAGQSVLNDEISSSDVRKFKKAFADLSVDEKINQYLDEELQITTDNPDSFTPKNLKKLLEYINRIEPEIREKMYFKDIEKAVQEIKETMNPVNRFEHKESAFIHAIRNGEWVLIDGIESAPSVIAEKISSLCSENPELNLFEYGPKFYFAKNNDLPPENRIHDNFHLFITYNPNSMKESQMIDQTFLVKSVTFTLPAIDERKENSAQMLLGSLINLNYPPDISKELAARYASMHQYAKQESQKNPDDFAGDIQYNGRTLKFATKVFSIQKQNKEKKDNPISDLSVPICFSTKSFYWNSYINEEKAENFHKNCINHFKQAPNDEFLSKLQIGDMTPEIRNKKILILLRNIQKFILGRTDESLFTLKGFIQLCNLTRISDLQYIQNHIKETIKLIISNSSNKEKISPIMKYGSLNGISALFEQIIFPDSPIKREHTFLLLQDVELKNNNSISRPLAKYELLNKLITNTSFSEDCSLLLENDKYTNILHQISIISSNFDKKLIIELFKFMEANTNLIDFVNKIFPYYIFKESKLERISYWLPLSIKLITNEIRFSIKIDDTIVEFNKFSTCDFSIDLIMNEKDNLSLSKNSTIHYQKNKKSMKVKDHGEKENDKYDLTYYSVINVLSNDPKQLIDNNILGAKLSKAKESFSKGQIQNPSKYSIISLKDLFIQNDDNLRNTPVINLIWNLIYTISEDEIVDLSKIIHPIESRLLLSAAIMFKSINNNLVDGIIEWTKWASTFENDAPILYKSILDPNTSISSSKIDHMIDSINDEIEYLKKAPDQMKEFWNSEFLIGNCQKELIKLMKIKNDNDNYAKELEIQSQISKLIDYLVGSKVSDKYKKMKIELINQLGQITEFSNDKLNFAQKIVKQFLTIANTTKKNDKNSFIVWPIINTSNYISNKKTENIKVFETLIWYSQISTILKDINNGNDLIQNLWKLNDFEEMTYPREILFTNLIKNAKANQSGLTLKDKNQALFTLNANMIFKLYSINKTYINDPAKLCETVNNYMKRSNCDEVELQWIYKTVSTLPSDFNLLIPKFEPNDLVFLIVNKKSISDFRNGPLFVGIHNEVFLKDLEDLMHQHFDKFSDAVKAIGQITYQTILYPNEQPPQNYTEIKNAFKNANRVAANSFDIIKRIEKIFIIAESLDNWNDKQLVFNDVSFLSSNWLNDSELLNNFPSLVFWLCKNQQLSDTLILKYKNYHPEPNKIPLWLLALRMMSSQSCIEFDSKSQTDNAKIIGDVISSLIKNYLKTSNAIDYNWINILISNLPNQISVSNIQIIHTFFGFLSIDNQKHPSPEINQMKNNFIKDAISKIIKSILSGKSKKLVTNDFNDSKSMTQFLAFPSIYIQNKIQDHIYEIIRSILFDKSTKQLRNFINSIDNFRNIIENLKNAIDEDQYQMKIFYEDKINKENEKRKLNKIQETKELIDKYNSFVYEIIHSKYHTGFNEKVKSLLYYQKQLQTYSELFKNEGFNLISIDYSSNYYDVDLWIYKNNMSYKYTIPRSSYVQTVYLLPDEELRREINYSAFHYNIKKTDKITFKYIYEDFDIEQIITNSTSNIKPEIPKIVFGTYYQDSKTFLNNLEKLFTYLNSFEEKFFSVLEFNQNITKDIFSFLDNINNLLIKIMSNLQAQFPDNTPSPTTQGIVQNELKDFLDDLYHLISEVTNITQTKLFPIWKAVNDNKQFTNLFNYQYNIQIPKISVKSQLIPNFSSITNINSLASPIICISPDNKIICSVKELKCPIGPIFPSLIYNPYIISIISFINEDVTYNIEHLSDSQYDKMISTKDLINKNEPIQLSIMPPSISRNEPEILTIKGDINIKSKSYEKCTLPFELTLAILPLKFRLRCLEYKMAEENNQYLRLCCDKIISGSKLNFEAINYYIHNHFVMAVEIEPLDENDAKQPEISIDKIMKKFSIIIPKVDEPTRCQFIIIIAFSQNLTTTIHCDFIIMPLIFVFEIFDFISKKYESSRCQIMFVPGSTKTLYLRMMSLFPFKQTGQISYNLPQSIQLIKEKAPINEKFEINGDFSFNLKLRINPNYKTCPSYGNFHISLEIGKIKKSIQIKFVDPSSYILYTDYSKSSNDDFLKQFPCYSYNYDNKKWISIKNDKELIVSKPTKLPYIIVSPFKFYTNIKQFNIIDYNRKGFNTVSVSNYENIKYLQLTNTEDQDKLFMKAHQHAIYSTKSYSKYVVLSDSFNYYSILGYDKNDKNIWFPAFDVYPNIKNIQFLEFDDKNAELAENNLYEMRKEICQMKIKEINEYFKDSKTSCPIHQTNFVIFMAILMNKDVAFNIETILSQMPNEVNNQFTDILSNIKKIISTNKKLSKEICKVISHNLILKFVQVFSQKYKEIESHQFCLQLSLTKSEIEAQQQKASIEFMKYDSQMSNTVSTSTTFHFVEKENILSKISVIPLPDILQRHDCFIISEKEAITHCLISDELGSFDFNDINNDESIFSDTIDSIASLPNLELPKVLSIQNMNLFYSTCSQGASILPTYIRSNQIKKMDQKKSEIYFATLLEIYKEVTKESTLDRSILSHHVNSFIESFKNCVKRLKRAGVDFKNLNLPQSCNNSKYNYSQDFIRSPDIETPTLRHVPWKTKNQVSENYMKFTDPTLNKGKYTSIDTVVSQSFENIMSLMNDEENLDPEETSDDDHNTDYNEDTNDDLTPDDIKFIYQKVASVQDQDEDEEILNQNEQNDQKKNIDKPPLQSIKPGIIHSQIQNTESVDGLFAQFTELDGIERVLERIKQMKKDGKLKFSKSTECKIDNQNDLFTVNKSDFPVKNLLDYSQNLIANLICKASDTNCPFLYMSCNLLIDCSSFISLENKLYSFMLLSSFSYALSALEIPFSIAIVADQKFRFVLKPFEEDLSILVLQRVLDCLFIKRYRTNIADTFHHAIEFMKCPSNNRTQRAMFLFSNGLDENLILAQNWKDTLLNNPNNSFGMIFIKSKLLDNHKYSSIHTMWDDFIKVVKNSQSITKLTAINADLNTSTIDAIITNFADVLSRSQDQKYQFDMNKIDPKPEFKQSYDDLQKNVLNNVVNEIDYDFSEVSSSVFRKLNQRYDVIGVRFPKLDVAHYRNKTEKITNTSPEHQIKEEFDQFIHKIVYSKRNSFRPLLETIFKPNKASQTVLSSTGTDFDITALILNLINPVPDPLIYLEEKGGLIRNYGVSIIIDSSKSCFNPLSSSHSYQTIKTLFTALSSIDIPCIDVIVATSSTPIVLCSEIPSLRLFNDKSPFWPSLFNCLNQNCDDKCDLEAAIHAAYDIRRMRTVDSTSYMFVFTDGLFQTDQKDLIKSNVMTCLQSGISVFGIGIGIYPCGIADLFPQAIFATNPNYLIHGIASCFGDDSADSYNDSIKHLVPVQSPFSVIRDSFKELIKNEDKPVFKDLKKYLSDVQHAMDAFSDMYNEEQEARNERGELINPEGLNTEMYVKDILKGQKILIVMTYDCRLNLKENPKVQKKFLLEPENAGENAFVKKAVEFFGIDIVIVQNYKDAIKELTKQTQQGKCDYYATWVLSGLPYDMKLPDGGSQYFVMQFIDCLIQFWNNGGSVVLFAEGEPLTFQANLFLEKVVFPNNSKTQLRVGGNHKGKKILKGDITGKLNEPGKFNKYPLAFKHFQRASLAHNLIEIYEGETISYAPNDKSKYAPFIPFMKDSENGISALFYPGGSDHKSHTGDIIVDCGYTKLFDKMTAQGTFRYIQNIAGWTAQCELKRIRGIKPKDFRPKAVVFQLDENQKCTLQKPPGMPANTSLSGSGSSLNPSSLRTLFAIDHSGSVSGVSVYHNKVANIFRQYNSQRRDQIITWGSRITKVSFQEMQRIYNSREGTEGTDPSMIASALINDSSLRCEHLVLVTDGQVSSSDVQRSDRILSGSSFRFRYVTTYVIGDGGDLSVGSPFTRGCGSHTVQVSSSGSERIIRGANAADFNVLDSVNQISSLDQFRNYFRQLFSATKQKMIGTSGDSNLRNNFQNLKTRLKNAGNLPLKAEQVLDILIGIASGNLQNVFDINTISAMEDDINSMEF